VLGAGSQTLNATFTPTDATDYNTNTGSVTLTVNKATPTITWATPSTITYGTGLSSTQLNATSGGVAGSFVYSPVSGTVLGAGSQTLNVTFTPTDSTDYNSNTGSVTLTVNKATPTITWTTPSPISYGTALSSTQLNASSGGVAGSFAYSPVTGTVLGVGSHTLNATFTPTDATDYNSNTGSVTLTVNKATPTIAWTTPSAITYGTALSSTQLNASTTPAGSFVYSPVTGTVLGAGSQTLNVTFTPTDTTDYNSSTGSVTLTVNKATPTITWTTPSAITYGTALSSTQLSASTTPAGSFVYSPVAGTVLGAGSQTLNVTFTPTDTTDYNSSTGSVTLTVNKATPTITWTTPSAITYGTALSATQLNATSGGVAGSFAYSPVTGTVLGAGSQTLNTTFTPTDATDYNTNTGSVTLTVNKATPTITWATPSTITYGTALSATQLNASSGGVAGGFVYSPVSGTVLGAGSQTLNVTFTPTDTTDYNPNTGSVTLTVNKATPTITWTTPSAITYGAALSSTQLNASTTPAGSFVYSPVSGTVLGAGSQTLNVTFTPTDATDYNTNTGSVTLTVNKATPGITWGTPSAITYGTALSSTQLNASTTPAGSFVYSPVAGTVLGAGSQTLNVTFTPTDTTDYNSSTGSVTLTVNKATPTITWTTPSAITYGTALSATQLNASSGGVAGSFVYSPVSGTLLGAGSQTLNASFTPTDATDYNTNTGSVTLTVNKATPTITWATPSAITYGTALSATQLNASSGGVAGSFVYTPVSGTVLGAGSQTLNTTFTPTDATDYNTNTGSVTLTVNQATKTITFPQPTTPVSVNGTASLTATASNGDAVTYTITSGTASLSASTITYTTAGTVTIAANSASTANYSAAATVSNSVTVNAASVSYTAPTTTLGSTSATQTATINFSASATLGTISVVTQGAAGLDYAYVSGGTCAVSTAYTTGQACSVNYIFAPLYPGVRYGAVVLLSNDSTPVLLGTSYMTGSGTGPLVAMTPGVISTVAGNHTAGYTGDGAAATSGELHTPSRVAVDSAGNIYIADSANNTVRKVTASTGFISTLAGTGTAGFSGDGGTATSAKLSDPNGVSVDGAGNVYIADYSNNRVRKITVSTGIIATVAGNGTQGYSGDGGQATSAELYTPGGATPDGAGNLYISDAQNNRVRKVSLATGVITTVAGTGTGGYSGDGGLATSAKLSAPVSVAFDSAGNFYIADYENNVVRKVTIATGFITTVAGTGTGGYSGDGGPATSAKLFLPCGIALDSAGNLYIADSTNNRIRKVDSGTGYISTVAGTGTAGYTGNSGAATGAKLSVPNDVALAGAGSLSIADSSNNVIRKVDISQSALTFATSTAVDSTDSTDDPQTATVENIGNASLTVSTPASGTNPSVTAPFSLDGATTCPQLTTASPAQTLTGGQSCTYAVDFAPTAVGGITGSLVLTDNSLSVTGTTQSTSLIATAIAVGTTTTVASSANPSTYSGSVTYTATVAPASGSAVPTGTVQFSIDGSNVGSAVTLSGSDTATYTTSSLTGGTHDVKAIYTTNSTNYTGSTSPTLTQTVNKETPTITWSAPSAITYGTALSSIQLNATASVAGTFAYSPASGTLPGAGSQTLNVTFTPTDATDYNTNTGSVILTVNKATPTITWGTPSAITYGTALSATQLNASSGGVAGSFVYSPVSGTVLGAGSQTLNVTFTPTDATDYNSSTGSVTLTVNKATPTITWTTPSAITYGTALSATQLDASSGGVAGSFVYSPVSGTVLGAGSQTLNASFTPTDATDYNASTGSVTLTVNKATPTITWTTPSAITYGTALSGTQLNASSGGVAGSFVYSPVSGTVLSAGSQTLNVTFTPTDTTDYNSSTGSVTLTVNKATPTITWTTPSAITYGAALSPTQLNAATAPAGSFVYSPISGTVLGAGSQALNVTFTPTDTTDYNTNTGSVTLTVNKATPGITWGTPSAITYGTALSGTQLNASSGGVAGSFVYSPVSGTVLGAGSQTLNATFTPTDATDYNTNTGSVTLTVGKATPTVTWATPSTITYGTGLSSTQLNASSGGVAGSFAYSPASGTVLGAGSQTLNVTFTPTDTSDYNSNTGSVTLTVNKATPTITWSAPSAIAYGTALSSTQLNASSGGIAGSFVYSPVSGTVLGAGTQTLNATFTPTDSTDYNSNSGSVILTVNKATPTITWSAPSAITYGTALSSTQLNASSGGVVGTFAYSPTSGTVLGTGSQTLNVTFTPTDSADYNSNTGSVTLTVNKATPAITWANPAAITYGTALSSTQLNASSGGVAGSFVYSPISGTVLGAGSQTLNVTFTPTDTADYNSNSGSVTLSVNKATPTITWTPPSAITYGTALSSTQLNASSGGVAGSFVYSPVSGTVLGAGSQTLSVTFTPTNTTDNNTNTGSVTLTVNKATPSIIWATPSAFTYGAALSSIQLNASAGGVAGSFAYSPASGTVLGAGSQTLNATFTPTDSTDYNSNTGSVTLTVNKATPSITWTTPSPISYGTALSSTQLNASSGGVAGTFVYAPVSGTVLGAGSQTLSITFTPTDATDYNSNSGTVTLTVNQATPTITWTTPTAISYGTALSSTQLNASSGAVAGSLVYSPVTGTVLGAGSHTLSVTFTPTNTTDYNSSSGSVTLAVNKTTPTITWGTPSAITYGTALSSTQLNASSGGVTGSLVYSPVTGTVLGAGSHTLSVTFTPADSSDYNSSSGSVSLTVDQATPTITWPAPAAITFGTALSATQLNASSGGVAGSFLYSPLSGTVLGAGSQPLNVTFTPADTTDYNTSTGSVTLTVNKAAPAITWSTPSAITYGTALSSTQLDASSGGLAGSFVYSPASGTMLGAGSQTLNVTFTPSDPTDYNTLSGSVSLTVNAAALSVSIIGNPTKAFDSTTTATLSSSNYNLTGFAGSDGATITKTVGSYAAETPGPQTVTVILSPSDYSPTGATSVSNYVLPTTATGAGTISIGSGLSFSLLGQTINAYAGQSGSAAYGGDGGLATASTLSGPASVAIDQAGNLYLADRANSVIRKITQAGYISTYAGTGAAGYSGDGGAATSAQLSAPWGVAADSTGNLYIADTGNNRIRKVTSAGIISTFAGTGVAGFGGDGAAATSAQISSPYGVAIDSNSNLYIADAGNRRIRKVVSGGNITTYAGNGTAGYSGDGAAASSAELNQPMGLAVDSSGNLYIADENNNRVRMIEPNGTISTVAGNGNSLDSGDSFNATSAGISAPLNMTVDPAGNLYIAEAARVRWVSTAGVIQTFAGTGTAGSAGNGGPATSAQLGSLSGISLDALGQIYLSDTTYDVIRRITLDTSFPATNVGQSSSSQPVAVVVNTAAAIQSIAVPSGYANYSVGTVSGCTVDGSTINPAGTVCSFPMTFAPQYAGLSTAPLTLIDGTGTKHTFALRGTGTGAEFAFFPGLINTFAGTGSAGATGDGGPASAALLNLPHAIAVAPDGTVYIADFQNDTIRAVNPAGIISTMAGTTGTAGYSGDGGAATAAQLTTPSGILLDSAGNLYISDFGNHAIRKIDANGIIATVVGTGSAASDCPTGGLAASAALNYPSSTAFDSKGDLYIADAALQCVVVVYASGYIATFAGTGAAGFSGDAGPALSAQLNSPATVAVDSNDNVYIADAGNNRIRMVNAQGVISTVVGNGTAGDTGDYGPALSAELDQPYALALDAANSLSITDNANQAVRVVDATGTIYTIVGSGHAGYDGDGGGADTASLYLQSASGAAYNSYGVADVNGKSVYIADTNNHVIRIVDLKQTDDLSFPNTPDDSTSAVESVIVANVGNSALNFSSLAITSGFELSGTCSPSVPLLPNTICYIGVAYAPTEAVHPNTGTLTILDNAPGSPQNIDLEGTNSPEATLVSVAASPSPAGFGQTVTLTAQVTTPDGDGDTPPGTVTFYDGASPLGTLTLDPAAFATLNISTLSLGSHSITVSYSGSANYLPNTSPAITETISSSASLLTWTDPAAITYGTALSSTQLSATASVAGTFVYSPAAGTLLTGGLHTLQVTFTPTDTADYSSASSSVTLEVNKGASTVTWATPAAITYGTALSSSQLNATGSVPGTFVYSPPSGTVLSAGSHTLGATFSPTDGTDYNNSSGSVTLVVNPATPTITWSAPSAISYGTALNSTQLNATSGGVAGSFVYSPAAGAVLGAGSQTLNTTFTPTDTTDYNTSSDSVTLTVNSAGATVTWATPAAITFGTALSSSQLDATASVPGSFVYSPGVGTVLAAGSQTLDVTFTPTDTSDYGTSTGSVTLLVNKATPSVTWATPAAIAYGTALSATQLDATASVPGTFVYSPASGTVLGAGSQTLNVTFTPTDATDYNTNTGSVNLSVNKATPAITWPTPAGITYGSALSSSQLDATASVAGTFVYSPVAGTVLGAGSQTLNVTFSPTDSTDYNGNTGNVTLTVNKATPAITWATPASINYGTALSATQLNASSGAVAGSFVYSPISGTVLGAGSQALNATFTPTDAADYNTSTGGVTLIVNPVTSTITWAAPAAITFGTALSSTQLDATASVAGTFVYAPPAGSVPGTGSQTLSATFTPTDTTDYNTNSGSVTLMVNKAAPTITWATPSPIPYGTALSAAQLDATAGVPGTFVYSPAAGTVLGAGSPTLSVTFTPTDTADYNLATGTVTLIVNKATTSVTWATPSPITYGTALSASQLDATGSVPGTLAYSPPAGTVPDAGSQTLNATLTPTDSTDYSTANGAVTLVVNKATTTLTWATPSPITFGSSLSSTQLNATASVPGSFIYSPPAGTLPGSGSQTLNVTFAPADSTDYNTATAAVTLVVNKATPEITWSSPSPIAYGTALSSTQLDASAGLPGTFTYSPAAGTILEVGSQDLNVTFTPTDSTDHNSASGSVILIVNKVNSTLAWSNPAAIAYGTALSSTQLNATASVPGTFIYSPVAGTVLAVGTQTLNVTFTPTDLTDHTSASGSVTLVVNKAAATITWSNPAAIAYGAALSSTQLNATASVPGTFIYSPALGSVLGVGSQTLLLNFTPTDSTNYNPATATATLVVSKTTPPLTWTTPPAIAYGTALSSAQLNATASVPGTFIYSPASGTVLDAGSQTLSVTFTPSDSTDYSPATATVTLLVSKSTPSLTWATPSAISYATPLSSAQLNAAASVPGTFVYAPPAGTVLGTGSQTLNVTFTPTNAVDYNSNTASVTLTVNKSTPALTWATPAAINYGTALSATQLNASSGSTPGRFVYSPVAGTTLGTGSQTLSATFTPTDSADYSTATATVTLLVNKATLALTWNAPSAIPYGTALSSMQLDARASVPGGFVYTPVAGTLLGAGSQTLSATFTPTDSADYNSATATTTLVVNKVTPTLTWATPSAMPYGAALSATQLNASANVPGSFVYSPVLGTLLSVGSQALDVTFTPIDLANHTSATATVNQSITAVPLAATIIGNPTKLYDGTNSGTLTSANYKLAGFVGADRAVVQQASGTYSAAAAGTETVTATLNSGNFTPVGSTDLSNYVLPAIATGPGTIASATLTVKTNNATRPYGAATPAFSGSVTGQQAGDSFHESFTTTATESSPAGQYAIVPSVSGANLSDYAVVAVNGQLTITPLPSTISLSASATTVAAGQSISLTATVTSSGISAPTGDVQFFDGPTLLATVVLQNGSANYSALLSAGSHSISAIYSGETNIVASSTVNGLQIVVGAQDFKFALLAGEAPMQLISAASPASYKFLASPMGEAFPGTVTFSLTGLPENWTHRFTPSSISATAGSTAVTLTVRMKSVTPPVHQPPSKPTPIPSPLPNSFLLLPPPRLRRVRESRRLRTRASWYFLGWLLIVAALAGISACGGGGFSSPTPPPQTYTLKVTATSGTIHHEVTLTLRLQ
jgi:hypothetical protein